MLRSRALAACTVLALLACSGCQASATNVIVTKDDRALFPIAAPFVFGPNGHIDMTLKDLQPYHRTGKDVPDPNVARMGFFMTTSEAQAHDLSRGGCPLDGDNLIVLFTLDAAWRLYDQAYTYKRELREMIQNYHGGEFSLFFANCEPQSAVSFDLQVSLYNVEMNGKSDHVSIGENVLSTVSTVRSTIAPEL